MDSFVIVDHVHEKIIGEDVIETEATAALYDSKETAYTKLELLIVQLCKKYAEHSTVDIAYSDKGQVVRIRAINERDGDGSMMVETFHVFSIRKSSDD